MKAATPCSRTGRSGSARARVVSGAAVFALIVHTCASRAWSPTTAGVVVNIHTKTLASPTGATQPPQGKCALLSSYASSAAAPACMADVGAGRAQCLLKDDRALSGRHTNVALLVTGTGYIEEAAAALNSLLYHRSCPIHAFMVADTAAAAALQRHAPWNGADAHPHFTWSLVQLPDNPYDATDGVTSPFRGHALLKCAMDRLLPADVDRVVVTDLDVLWTGDVCDMHDDMDAWHPDAFVGMAPEDAYCYAVPERVGVGFPIPDANPYKLHRMDGVNSGVIAYKLARARRADFTTQWAAYMKRVDDPLPLGDQDVFNLYLQTQPQYLHILPNQWNHQLHLGGNCGSPLWRGVRVLHANGPDTKLNDPIMRQWWHAFANSGIGTYKNQPWERLSDADKCCMRSALHCLAAHAGLCDFGAWSSRVLGTPFYSGRGFHAYIYA